MAVQEWLTRSGHSFWHKGLEPNITVPLPTNVGILLPENEQGLSPAQLRASGDTQLSRALTWLTESKPGLNPANN